MRPAALVILVFFITITCRAQQVGYTAFTVNDGLPSNNVYRCIEDNKGFLWVATDAGIARFDGKHFQVFTVRDGLPDNEVLAVVKERNGRIWVNCFKQNPAYFDEVQNRFINSKVNKVLAKVKEGTGVRYCFTLQDGGVMFANSTGSFIFRDNDLMSYRRGKKGEYFFIKGNADGSVLMYGGTTSDPLKPCIEKIYQEKNGSYVDSVIVGIWKYADINMPAVYDGKFYVFNEMKAKCYIYSNFRTNPIRYKVDSVKAPEVFTNFESTPIGFYLLGASGKLYLYDKNTLKLKRTVQGYYLANSMYNDSRGDLWISTIDKGLLFYKKAQIKTIEMPAGFTHTSFLSVAAKPDGTLLAGNFYGEIVEARGKSIAIKYIPKKGLIARQRKILISQNKIFTFSEAGTHVNYTSKPTGALPNDLSYGKTALVYNDSIILVGQSTSFRKLNTITEQFAALNAHKRVTAITKDNDGIVYFGSTDGLYKYIYTRDSTIALGKNSPLLSERIMALCATPDKLVWAATSGDGVILVKNDKVLLHISEKEGIINNACRSIITGRPGQVWLGTVGGISVINYNLHNDKITYTIQNLSVNDGLSNNVINEMLYKKDTIYTATGDGISVIPANISIPKFNIPVQLVHMSVNQRDTILSANYKLAYYQGNIQMQFAGIELTGHFKNFKYTIDQNIHWIDLDENTLTIQLSSGKHTVQVRAVDVNGTISNKILTIKFEIATPFWKTIWFWFLIALETQIIIIYLVNRRQKKRKETKLAKQIEGVQTAALEQQAFTSLMNPHFMFNALNSIQHYINVQDRQNANRYLSDFASLIRKNFEAAQQSFIPLEQEIENIKIYLRLEQMRFNDRFSYEIIIGEALDADDWMIPTMILQPLLENALLHGIMPSAIDGKVTIDLEEQRGNLLITITDNGIGMENSRALNITSGHKSRGTELIKKRIAALSRFGENAITIEMEIAFSSEKNPGNKITLHIPQGLHKAWEQAQRQ